MKVALRYNMANEEAISFYSKMSKARADILTLDWKDDKFLSLGGRNGYNYLSIDKIKRNLAPVLQTHGIDLGIEYCDLTQLGDANAAVQHWIVTLKASLIDVSTGFERTYTVFGESSDHGDKGVNKAQTAAMKQFLSNTFMLIDGIDPDAEDKPSAGDSFIKTPTETLVAKSRILANAVKPPVATEPAPKADVTKSVPEKASEGPKEGPKVEPKVEPKEEVKEGPVVAETPADGPVKSELASIIPESLKELNVTAPQRSAITRIIETRTKWATEGKLTPAEYNQMSADYADIKDQASGSAFISKYRVVGKLV